MSPATGRSTVGRRPSNASFAWCASQSAPSWRSRSIALSARGGAGRQSDALGVTHSATVALSPTKKLQYERSEVRHEHHDDDQDQQLHVPFFPMMSLATRSRDAFKRTSSRRELTSRQGAVYGTPVPFID